MIMKKKYNLSPIINTDNESNLQQEINILKEMFVSLNQQINEIKSCRTQKYSAIFLIKIFLQTDSIVPSKPKKL